VGAVKNREIYQLKLTLVGISPQIWRRIHVAGDCTLAQPHRVLQVAMGWENYHLYMFRIGGKTYGPPDPDFDGGLKLIDAKRMRVRAALPGVGTTFGYVYDFGDNWQHDLLLEAIIMPLPDIRSLARSSAGRTRTIHQPCRRAQCRLACRNPIRKLKPRFSTATASCR